MLKFDSEKGTYEAKGTELDIVGDTLLAVINTIVQLGSDYGKMCSMALAFGMTLMDVFKHKEIIDEFVTFSKFNNDVSSISVDLDAIKRIMKGEGNDETT